jgi:hypothetical protein
MFHARDCKTGSLFDKWGHMGPKRRKLLDDSWAGLFRREILPELPVEKLASAFDEVNGRPTKEMYTTLGALIFQQMLDLDDEETVRQLAFSIEWHFALDLDGESDAAKYICPRTLWTMRRILTEKKLDTVLFSQITDKLSRVFSVDTRNQRLDSVHIESNMRHLGRIGIFVRAIRGFLVNLKRHHRGLFESLDGSFSERYLTRKGQGVFSMPKPSESEKTLEKVAFDLFDLVRRFSEDEKVVAMSSYQTMSRVLSEQCTVESTESGGTVTIKPPGEVASDSLQNPSDPYATYCGHKGQGYQAQVMETYIPAAGADGEKEPGLSLITHVAKEPGLSLITHVAKEPGLSLITHVAVEPAHVSDAHALIPAIEDAKERGLGPAQLLADSLYGSEKNVAAAAAMGTEVVAPVPGGEKKSKSSQLSEFTLTEEGGIANCTMGHAPIEDAACGNHREVVFAVEHCFGCPRRKECPVKSVCNGYGFSYDKKQVKMARRRAREKTETFLNRYRFRAGIEATFSALDRLTGVKHLRVRGMPAVRFAVVLKALGLNLLRAAAVQRPKNGEGPAPAPAYPRVLDGIVSVHAQFMHLVRSVVNQFASYPVPARLWAATAA